MADIKNKESLRRTEEVFKEIYFAYNRPISKKEFLENAEEKLKDIYNKKSLPDALIRIIRNDLVRVVANEGDFDKSKRKRFSYIPSGVALSELPGNWYTQSEFEKLEIERLKI